MVETVLGMTDLQIKLVAAAGQLALTATVAYVAWQQWRTARNKLKADLFDRRFAAFEELRRTVSTFRNLQHMPEADAILALAPTFQYLSEPQLAKMCYSWVEAQCSSRRSGATSLCRRT